MAYAVFHKNVPFLKYLSRYMQCFEKSHDLRKVIARAREKHFNYNFFYFISTFHPLSNPEQLNRTTLIFHGDF